MNQLLTIIILLSTATVYCHGDGKSRSAFWENYDRGQAQAAKHIQKVWDIYNAWPKDEPLPQVLEEAVVDGEVSYKEARKIIPELRRIRVARELEARRKRIASNPKEQKPLSTEATDREKIYELFRQSGLTEESAQAITDGFLAIDWKIDQVRDDLKKEISDLREGTNRRFEEVDSRFRDINQALEQIQGDLAEMLRRLPK